MLKKPTDKVGEKRKEKKRERRGVAKVKPRTLTLEGKVKRGMVLVVSALKGLASKDGSKGCLDYRVEEKEVSRECEMGPQPT